MVVQICTEAHASPLRCLPHALAAGMVMLQLAVPVMRTDRALRSFNAVYGPKYKYDLEAWRKATHLNARECALLDADGGAGGCRGMAAAG